MSDFKSKGFKNNIRAAEKTMVLKPLETLPKYWAVKNKMPIIAALTPEAGAPIAKT